MRHAWIPLLLALPACRGVSTGYRYPDDLEHPNYVRRSLAAREWLRRAEDPDEIARGFPLLVDEDAHIRSLAHGGLKERLGDDWGYRAWLDRDVRTRVRLQWEAAWRARAEDAGG